MYMLLSIAPIARSGAYNNKKYSYISVERLAKTMTTFNRDAQDIYENATNLDNYAPALWSLEEDYV